MTRAWLLLLGLVVVWGSHWVVVKVGLETIPPFTYGVLRLASGMLVLAVLMVATKRLRRPYRGDLPIIFSWGLLAVAVMIITMNLALPYIPAGRSAILAYTTPLWIVPIMVVVARTFPVRAELVGLVLGLAGLVLLLNPAAIDWTADGALLGSLLLVLGAGSGALAMVHVRRHRWSGTPFDAQIWQLGVALLPMVLLAVVLEWEQLARIEWDLAAALAVLYSGPLATAFAFWASQMIVKALGPLTAGIGYLGAPVIGVIAGIIVLGEVITVLDVAGVLVTTAGIVVVLLAGRPDTSRSRPASGPEDALPSPDEPATLGASTPPSGGGGRR